MKELDLEHEFRHVNLIIEGFESFINKGDFKVINGSEAYCNGFFYS